MRADWFGKVRLVKLAGCLGLVVGLAGCSLFSCEDPLERELRERDKALAARPVKAYKAIKTALRAVPLDSEDKNEGLFGGVLMHLNMLSLLSPEPAAEGGGDSLMDYVALGAHLRSLSDKLDALDEDDYPTLLEKIIKVKGTGEKVALPFAWGSNQEHLILGLLWTGAKGAPPGLALYELHKVAPRGEDPALVHVFAPLFKALTYMRLSWPNLAEKEWTAYLQAIKTYRGELTQSGLMSETPEQDLAWLHILGRLGRAKVRMDLENDEGAEQDLEGAVEMAEKHGLDSEPTWVLGCYVALRKDDTEKATAYLTKLKASPNLGEDERELVTEVETYLAARDPEAGLRKLGDGLFAASALIRYAKKAAPVAKLQAEVEATPAGKRMVELQAEMQKLIEAFSPATKVKGLLDKAKDGVKKVLD